MHDSRARARRTGNKDARRRSGMGSQSHKTSRPRPLSGWQDGTLYGIPLCRRPSYNGQRINPRAGHDGQNAGSGNTGIQSDGGQTETRKVRRRRNGRTSNLAQWRSGPTVRADPCRNTTKRRSSGDQDGCLGAPVPRRRPCARVVPVRAPAFVRSRVRRESAERAACPQDRQRTISASSFSTTWMVGLAAVGGVQSLHAAEIALRSWPPRYAGSSGGLSAPEA